MEIQAAAQMESKEILTLPRIVPMQRTIATPLSPITSKTEANTEDFASSPCGSQLEIVHSSSSKSIQVELPAHPKPSACTVILDNNTYKSNKRSRSEEELSIKKRTLKKEILKLMQDLNNNSYCDMDFNEIDRKHQNVRHRCEFEHLSNNCRNLRRSMSDSVGFLNDFCVDENRQKTHECVNDILNRCNGMEISDINKSDVYRDQLLPEFMNNLKYLGSFYKPKVNDESYVCQNDYCDHNDSSASKRSHKNTNSSFLSNDSNFREDVTSLVNDNMPQATRQAELRNLIDFDILAFTQKYQLNITTASLHELREELLLLFAMNLANNSFMLQNYMKKNVKNTLRNRGFTESQAIYLTDTLTKHFQAEFSTNNSIKRNSPNIGSNTLIALPNITKNAAIYVLSSRSIKNESDSSLNEISQKDINASVNVYVNQISHELEEWLSNLQIPATQDNELRQTIIRNLANDIVDRKRYLELNPSSELSDVSELENLKYQIFKWVYKMVDSVDVTPLENASDLMNRIENITVPVFSAHRKKIDAQIHGPKVVEDSNLGATSTRRLNSPANLCCKRSACDNNINKDNFQNTSKRNYSLQEPQDKQPAIANTRRRSSPSGFYVRNTEHNKLIDAPQPTESKSDFRSTRRNALNLNGKTTDTVDVPNYPGFSGGIKIRDDDDKNPQYSLSLHQINGSKLLNTSEINKIDQQYPEYLKDWAEKIPIPAANDEEKMLVKKIRVKVCDDLHQIVSKLQAEPEILNNRFLCEDILDEEIEKILSQLPQDPELKSKKHILKVKLIEKIVENIEFYLTPSHNQKPIDIVKHNLPNAVVDESQNSDILELYEKLQILNIVEDFIACSHFQNEDQIMIEAYRNKLVKCTEAFVDELKARHDKALKNIETKSYLEDIMNTLQNVSIPSETSVQGEADKILVGIEIDKWFIELPLNENDELIEQLNRRRLRNSLVKQICGIEKSIDNIDPLKVKLKHEISQFLVNAPLQEGTNLNINAMVENLIKKLECRPRSIETDMKKVEFSRIDYGEFSRNMPCCSSYTEYRNPHEGVNDIQNSQISAHSHKSVQVVRQGEKAFVDLDSVCCKSKASLEVPPYHETLDNARSMSSSRRDDVASHWYTLQESQQERPQRNSTQISNTRFRPHYLSNASTSPNYREHQASGVKKHCKSGRFEGEFLVPQRHSNQDNSGFNQHRKPQSVHNQRSPPRKGNANRSPLSTGNQEVNREMSSHTVDQRYPTFHSPVMSSQRRERPTLNRGNLPSEHTTPHRTPHRLSSQNKFDRYENIPKRSPELQHIKENQHSAEINQSHVFHKTDKVNQDIERNGKTNSTMECHQPNVAPPRHAPVRLNSNKGYVDISDIEGKYQEEDSEEDTVVSGIRCKCMERMWRRKRPRPRYCPFDEYDGYPLCMPTPYFYPFFY